MSNRVQFVSEESGRFVRVCLGHLENPRPELFQELLGTKDLRVERGLDSLVVYSKQGVKTNALANVRTERPVVRGDAYDVDFDPEDMPEGVRRLLDMAK